MTPVPLNKNKLCAPVETDINVLLRHQTTIWEYICLHFKKETTCSSLLKIQLQSHVQSGSYRERVQQLRI